MLCKTYLHFYILVHVAQTAILTIIKKNSGDFQELSSLTYRICVERTFFLTVLVQYIMWITRYSCSHFYVKKKSIGPLESNIYLLHVHCLCCSEELDWLQQCTYKAPMAGRTGRGECQVKVISQFQLHILGAPLVSLCLCRHLVG